MTDKTTAVTYINKKGGTQSVSCNNMTKEIWAVFQKHQFHLSVRHIPEKRNILAGIL